MGVAYNTGILSSNLVFSVDAANTKSYTGSGTNMVDLCGVNNLVMSNVSYVSGSIPYFNFNGTTSYCYNYSANNVLSTGNTATVLIWVYPDTTQNTDTYNGMFSLGTKGCALGNGNGQTILFSMNTNRVLTMAKWCDDSTNGTLAPSGDAWSMVSLVKDGAITRFGVNGSSFQNTSNTGTQNFSGSNFTIGCTDNPGRYYKGRIASIYLYRSALTDAQIQQNFNATRGRFGV